MENPELEKTLENIRSGIHGVVAATVSTREGLTLVKATAPGFEEMGSNDGTDSSLASLCTMAVGQVNKFGFGEAKSIVSFYGSAVLVHINLSPLVITLVGVPDTNVGTILRAVDPLRKSLEPLRDAVTRLPVQERER